VTSKGGTTEAALRVLQEGGFEDLIARALQAGRARSAELADTLSASSQEMH
jgi:pyrroline-5-carboxylate reductase